MANDIPKSAPAAAPAPTPLPLETAEPPERKVLHVEGGMTLLRLVPDDYVLGPTLGFRVDVDQFFVGDSKVVLGVVARGDFAYKTSELPSVPSVRDLWAARMRPSAGAHGEVHYEGGPIVIELSAALIADMEAHGYHLKTAQFHGDTTHDSLSLGGAAQLGAGVDFDWLRFTVGVEAELVTGTAATVTDDPRDGPEQKSDQPPPSTEASARPFARLSVNF